MGFSREATLRIEEFSVEGYERVIRLRSYRPGTAGPVLPMVLYFHGGGFTSGSLDDADVTASFIARSTPAWVVSVDYSLSPDFPFPAALEDGYRAARWVMSNAKEQRADARRFAVAGHDAGGNLATCLGAMARDRNEFSFSAQALIAPLLNPSMTRVADEAEIESPDLGLMECARQYRAYLPNAFQRIHPYAAPLESRRLAGLPPALIATGQHDLLHVEAEKYAGELIAAGVPTEITRYSKASHQALATHQAVLEDVVAFFRKRLFTRPESR